MAIIKTDNQHYIDIANMIREKTGNSISYLPQDMASGVAAVYIAGYNEGLRQSGGDTMNYMKIIERVTLSEEDVTAAGEAGITCITVGNDNVDLTSYNDILIKFYIPISTGLNAADGMLRIYATPTDKYATSVGTGLLETQSLNISTVCGMLREKNNSFVVQSVWAQDDFLYGQVNRNGYSNSQGYSGAVHGWTEISKAFKKSEKKYFHIKGFVKDSTFKFPAGTWAEVYGR